MSDAWAVKLIVKFSLPISSPVSVVTRLGCRLGDRGSISERNSEGIFLFATMSTPLLGSTQPPIQLVAGPVSLGVKQAASVSVEVKNAQSYTFTLPILHAVVHLYHFTF